MARIFICYRREDSSGHAGRLRDALSARFGPAEIFRDVETIGPGDHFVQAMSRAIGACSVFLAVIGNQWLAAASAGGTRRLDDPEDHVRREIAEALGRGVRVVPVLVEGARMPRATELPEPLKELATRNAITLDDEGWDVDVERLAGAIRPEPGQKVARHSRLERRHVVAAVAAAGLLIAIALIIRTSMEPTPQEPSATSATTTSSVGEAVPTGNAAPTGRATPVTLPVGGEAALGEAVYQILEAGVLPHHGGSTLTLRIRMTNRSRYTAGLSDGAFRLLLNEEARAPTSGLGELVPAETAKDGTVTFELPANVTAGTLRITQANETGDVALDLSGRAGPTPAQDREARRAGAATFPVTLDPAAAGMRFGDMRCELRSATVRRYANKLTLTLNVRAHNGGPYNANLGDGNFRLVFDGMARAPVGGLNELVAAEGTRDGDVVFDLPLDAREVVLRTRFGDTTAELPLRLRR